MLLQKSFQPIFGVSLIKLFHLLFATLKLKYYITEKRGGQGAALSLNPSFNLKESLVCPVKSPKELFINYVSCFTDESTFEILEEFRCHPQEFRPECMED